jgi:hypothetical protein
LPTDLAAIVIDYAIMDDATILLRIIAERAPGNPLEVKWQADGAWPYRDFMTIGVPSTLRKSREYYLAPIDERIVMLEEFGLSIDHKPMTATDTLAYANWLSCAAIGTDSAFRALMRVIRSAG